VKVTGDPLGPACGAWHVCGLAKLSLPRKTRAVDRSVDRLVRLLEVPSALMLLIFFEIQKQERAAKKSKYLYTARTKANKKLRRLPGRILNAPDYEKQSAAL